MLPSSYSAQGTMLARRDMGNATEYALSSILHGR